MGFNTCRILYISLLLLCVLA